MSKHAAKVEWTLGEGDDLPARRYSRVHTLSFDGGAVIQGSASPSVVRAPFSDPAGIDPEELFVASIAACHMLWFLDLASRDGRIVERYVDPAEGVMANNAEGRLAVARVTLRPEVGFAEPQPSAAEVAQLHHRAHQACFIANSVRTEVVVEQPRGG